MSAYDDALEKLKGLINYEHTLEQPYTADNYDLDRYRRFLAELGSPEKYTYSLHVAGTKGKGSVCLIAESILLAHGVSVGTYLSPHMESYRERIRIDGEEISERDFVNAFEEIEGPLEKARKAGIAPTHFEVLTALAFIAFRNSRILRIMILEVGLGGRLDATNVCEPHFSVITPIGIEHANVLGDTIERIAREKAGIIREGVFVWTGAEGEALRVIREVARKKKTHCWALGEEFLISNIRSIEGKIGTSFSISFKKGETINHSIPLAGAHQARNAALAYAASTDILHIVGEDGGKEELIREGFSRVHIPGRVEILREDPPLILDVAHTPDSAKALADALRLHFPEKKHVIIVAFLNDKDAKGVLGELAPVAERFIATATSHPRSMAVEETAAAARLTGVPSAAEPDPASAVERALSVGAGERGVVITGSFYLAGVVRKKLTELLEN